MRISNHEYTHLKKCDALYNTLYRDIEYYRSSIQQSESSRLMRERQILEDEQEQLRLSKDNILVNLKHVEEEQETTEKTIQRQTKEYQSDYVSLKERNTTLHDEIESLKELLNRKMKEKEEVEYDLSIVTEKIDTVRHKYKKQLDKMTVKKDNIMKEFNDNEKEIQSIEHKLSLVLEQEDKLKSKIEEYIQQQQYAQVKREEIKKEISIYDEHTTEKQKINKDLSNRKQILEEEKIKLNDLMNSISNTTQHIKQIDSDIHNKLQEIKDIEDKITILEKNKKVAASSRNFLEANTISKEVKDKKELISTIQSSISDLNSQKDTYTINIQQYIDKQESFEGDVNKAIIDYNVVLYRCMNMRLRDISYIKDYIVLHSIDSIDINDVDHLISLYTSYVSTIYEQYKHMIDDDIPQDTDGHNSIVNDDQKQENGDSRDEGAKEEVNEENSFDSLPNEELKAYIDGIQNEYDRVEKEIDQAAENEDYELADQLNLDNQNRMDKLKKARMRLDALVSNNEVEHIEGDEGIVEQNGNNEEKHIEEEKQNELIDHNQQNSDEILGESNDIKDSEETTN